VIFAANLERTQAAVIAAGGTITVATHDFPGGRRFHFTDPTGLELAVWSDRRADGSKIE
jgi:predicted enzyme related to lactoylglutathione lyase